jgi:DNA-binding response OmpR family regulator
MPENFSVTIVLVEDDPGHARLSEKNVRRAHITNDMVVLRDGQEAVAYFFPAGEDTTAGRAVPLLVLLDLHLPGLDGSQVLARRKAEERTRRIPVIILTTTDDPRDVVRCYDLGCNVYLTKPVEYERFTAAIRQLGLFLSVVKIPEGA